MRKSIYSLILFDEVVEAVDRLAYENNTNRSQLINEILAEKLGLLTPEQKIKGILEQLVSELSNCKTMKIKASDSGQVQLGTFIKYKYNPTLNYSFEVCGTGEDKYLVLKVSSRTTSVELLNRLNQFFNILAEVDRRRFKEIHQRQVVNRIIADSNNKFLREFLTDMPIEELEEEYAANYLSIYVKMLDEAIRYYFSHLDEYEIVYNIDKIYCHYMKELVCK